MFFRDNNCQLSCFFCKVLQDKKGHELHECHETEEIFPVFSVCFFPWHFQ